MYSLTATSRFKKSFQKLPKNIQSESHDLLGLLAIDIRDSRLHAKKLRPPFSTEYSMRVHRDYRIIFEFEDAQTILLIDIQHRKDIYR